MALARIFSRHPQQAAALSLELQRQGYTVEVLNPEQTPATPAHLEIEVESCDPAEVLRRAEELASQHQADIAVAPGALSETSLAQPRAPVQTPAALKVKAAVCEPPTLPLAPETPAQAASSTGEARVASTSGSTLAAFAAAAGDWLALARAAFHEHLEQARMFAAEANVRRQERLLELARRQAEARQRAFTAESSRRALAVYLLQLQRPLPEAVDDSASVAGPVASASQTEVPGAPDVGAQGWEKKIKRLRMTKWEAVLAATASATALFVAGLAIASFHSHQAASAKPDVSAQSGGVNMKGPQPKPHSPHRPGRVGKAKPRPVEHKVRPKPQQRDQALIARDVVIRHFPTPKPTPTPQATGWKHFSDLSH